MSPSATANEPACLAKMSEVSDEGGGALRTPSRANAAAVVPMLESMLKTNCSFVRWRGEIDLVLIRMIGCKLNQRPKPLAANPYNMTKPMRIIPWWHRPKRTLAFPCSLADECEYDQHCCYTALSGRNVFNAPRVFKYLLVMLPHQLCCSLCYTILYRA